MAEIFQIGEIVEKILGFVADGTTHKNVRLVCRGWLIAAGDRIDEFCNQLWTLIDKFPYADWDWEAIIKNPNTLLKFILDFNLPYNKIDFKQDIKDKIKKKTYSMCKNYWYIILTHNSHMTQEIYKRIPQLRNTNQWLVLADVIPEKLNISTLNESDFNILSYNPNLTWNFINKHRNKNWDWYNINICDTTIEKILNAEIKDSIMWEILNWKMISRHPNITWDHISKNPDLPWGDIDVTRNPNITWDIIVQKYMTMDEVELTYASSNPNVTWDLMMENPKMGLSTKLFSLNPNVTWRLIMANLEFPWSFKLLSQNIFNGKLINKKFTRAYITDSIYLQYKLKVN